MVGSTLSKLRRHIEALEIDGGRYYLVCGRTGDRPVPTVGRRFESRETADRAVRATERYRSALRRYDPQLPYYDLIVCEEPVENVPRESDSEPSSTASGRRQLIEFCHTVAGAVFEIISESPHDAVERAVMDTYLDAAESIESPDELCLRLLESMSVELENHLTTEEQAATIRMAAERISSHRPCEEPLSETLAQLHSASLVSDYTLRPSSTGSCDDRMWDVTITAYALDTVDGRIPTLPIIVELFSRCPDSTLQISHAERFEADDSPLTWRFSMSIASDGAPAGLVSVPEVSN
ncbi:hypothetical protein ACFFQF_25930 [Haladaptatus pallidirubidus]|uniref:Uncharacterized protein n=1 Tax=Haladaptatus pallidirubidus TaxID=1008152 RepID=A0AAV3UN58_9EURY|nr:hypothetical protein [Haladaptatus pallidirubidus]